MSVVSNSRSRKIHLVAAGKARRHPNTRLTLGEFIADVLISKKDPPRSYYIIQRVGSAEIIDWQQFENFDSAERAAKEALEAWHRHEQQKAS